MSESDYSRCVLQWLTWSSRGWCWVWGHPESGSAPPCTEGWCTLPCPSTAEAIQSDCTHEACSLTPHPHTHAHIHTHTHRHTHRLCSSNATPKLTDYRDFTVMCHKQSHTLMGLVEIKTTDMVLWLWRDTVLPNHKVGAIKDSSWNKWLMKQ